MRFILIANPENRRVEFFRQALERKGCEPAAEVSYMDLLTGKERIENHIRPRTQTVLRIESPGENAEVERRLIALGAEKWDDDPDASWIDPGNTLDLPESKGRIYYPAQWFRGFRYLLQRLYRQVYQAKQELSGAFVHWMNHPDDIIMMFDKRNCHHLLSMHGIPVPFSPGQVESYAHLRETMESHSLHRVFLKLAYSSSASGIIAYEINNNGSREQAHTTMEAEQTERGPVFFNSLKVRRVQDNDAIREMIDWLCREGVHVEQWIPKARSNDHSFDIRQVVIGGTAMQRVLRLSKTPLTNLHLGNQRGGDRTPGTDSAQWQAVEETAVRAMAVFPDSMYAGVDMLIPRGGGTPYVLELNAFGDLLPGISYEGEDTYESEISCAMQFFFTTKDTKKKSKDDL